MKEDLQKKEFLKKLEEEKKQQKAKYLKEEMEESQKIVRQQLAEQRQREAEKIRSISQNLEQKKKMILQKSQNEKKIRCESIKQTEKLGTIKVREFHQLRISLTKQQYLEEMESMSRANRDLEKDLEKLEKIEEKTMRICGETQNVTNQIREKYQLAKKLKPQQIEKTFPEFQVLHEKLKTVSPYAQQISKQNIR